jgi:hypothetical protein
MENTGDFAFAYKYRTFENMYVISLYALNEITKDFHVATVWLLCGYCVATVWLLCGYCAVALGACIVAFAALGEDLRQMVDLCDAGSLCENESYLHVQLRARRTRIRGRAHTRHICTCAVRRERKKRSPQ